MNNVNIYAAIVLFILVLIYTMLFFFVFRFKQYNKEITTIKKMDNDNNLFISKIYEEYTCIFKEIENKIQIQLAYSYKNSIFHLFFGSIISSFAVFILLYSFLIQNGVLVENNNINKLLISSLPKITIVLFLQILSGFFLKLYKKELLNIERCYNELLSFSYKKSALLIILTENNKSSLEKEKSYDLINEIIVDLSKLGNKQLIPKGFTTEEIEKEKISIKENCSILETIKDLLKQKN